MYSVSTQLNPRPYNTYNNFDDGLGCKIIQTKIKNENDDISSYEIKRFDINDIEDKILEKIRKSINNKDLLNNSELNKDKKKELDNEYIIINNNDKIKKKSIVNTISNDDIKLLILNNGKKINVLLTRLGEKDIKEIKELLAIFNYSKIEFLDLDNKIKIILNNIENFNKLKYIGFINNENSINYKIHNSNSFNKEDLIKKIENICSFIDNYGELLDDKEYDFSNNEKECEKTNALKYISSKNNLYLPYDESSHYYHTVNDTPNDIIVSQNINDEIKNSSFIILFNNITKEYRLIDNTYDIKNKFQNDNTYDNPNWYLDFFLYKNKNINTLLKQINIDIIKFMTHDKYDCENIKDTVININYENIGEIENNIKDYCDNLSHCSSMEYLKKLITNEYDISSNPKDIIQFTDIYNHLLSKIQSCSDDNKKAIKHILPYVLSICQLKKKRTSKGMMWFGMRLKQTKKKKCPLNSTCMIGSK